MEKAIATFPGDEALLSMRRIPAGPFLMGAEGWGKYEGPIREVFVDDFFIDPTPVTNALFANFVRVTGYRTTAEVKGHALGYENGGMKEITGLSWKTYNTADRQDHPVVLVSWHDASAYAQWAGKRLPYETEWEKAARGGKVQALYPWGDGSPDLSLCNFGRSLERLPATTPVYAFPWNGYGLWDMAGNVWNWCADPFIGSFDRDRQGYPAEALSLPKIRRGGGFNVIQPFRLRCANRGAYYSDAYAINIGFRCAKSI